MDTFVLVTLHLILVHTLDGHEITFNPEQVTHLGAAKQDEPNKMFTDEVRCMINFADGKFVNVLEHCDVVKQMMEDAK